MERIGGELLLGPEVDQLVRRRVVVIGPGQSLDPPGLDPEIDLHRVGCAS